jgi:hypothetical protein
MQGVLYAEYIHVHTFYKIGVPKSKGVLSVGGLIYGKMRYMHIHVLSRLAISSALPRGLIRTGSCRRPHPAIELLCVLFFPLQQMLKQREQNFLNNAAFHFSVSFIIKRF